MTLSLETLTLTHGAHDSRTGGVCLLEAVAWFAGEPHSDHPACASLVLGAFGRRLSDVLPDDRRQRLVRLVPLMPGTAGDGLDEDRGYMALDWLIRTYAPAWLDLAGLSREAAALRDLRRIAGLGAAQAAAPAVVAVRGKAAAAWAAAGAAAGDEAGDEAGAADRAAAGAAAGAAARDAAGSEAGAAARDAARAAAWAAAWAADRAAAGAALAPTVSVLQDSAIALLAQMISPGGAARTATCAAHPDDCPNGPQPHPLVPPTVPGE